MNTYIYPENLRSQATLWMWSLKSVCVIGISLLFSILALAQLHTPLLLGITAGYAFLTIRLDETTVLDFIGHGIRYFISTQQYYQWTVYRG